MDKILVTGADGFIGSHLVEELLNTGTPLKSLRLLVQKGNSLSNLPDKKFDIVWGDIRDKKVVKKAVKSVSVIYHLAAVSGFGGDTYEDYRSVNVDGTQNLLDACSNNKIKNFVFYSTIAVYGLPAWAGNIKNWNENHPKNYSEIYGRSKYEAEKRLLDWHKTYKHSYIIIRPASVYGPRDKGQLYGLYKAIKSHRFFIIGDGKNKMHFIYVKDLVKATIQAQKKKKNSDYILAGKKPTQFNEIVKDVARSISTKTPNISIPTNLALGLSYVLDFLGKIIGIKSPLFPSRVKVLTTNYYYDISKAKKEFGFKPNTSFKEGTIKTGKWYLENGYL